MSFRRPGSGFKMPIYSITDFSKYWTDPLVFKPELLKLLFFSSENMLVWIKTLILASSVKEIRQKKSHFKIKN
jgi:hypothetical protein